MSAGSVLVVGNFLSRDRWTRAVCEDLARRLEAAGWNVITASDRPARLARLADMAGTAWRERKRYDVALVDVYSGRSFLWAETVAWTLRRARKPYILTLHGGNLPGFARRWPGRLRRLVGSAAAVTAPSRWLIDRLGPFAGEVRFVPNPLEVERYTFRLRDRPEPRLVWLRGFHAIYHPEMAIEVLADVIRDWPDARLAMFGPDKGDGSLDRTRELAARLGVADRVEITGGVPKREVPACLQAGDIFLNTSRVDNAPVTVVEAMACGLCVVSTDVGGLPDLVEHGRNALLAPVGDGVGMAAAVRRILGEPALAERLSRSGRRAAEERDWSRVLPLWDSLLTTVAKNGRSARRAI